MSETNGAVFQDKEFNKALGQYCDFRKNVDPKKELRRRAKNVGMRLIRIYKAKGVVLSDITRAGRVLGPRLKIRPKIRAMGKLKGWTHKQMLAAELRARKSARGFTATGWFNPVEKLGGTPRDNQKRTGPRRGKLVEKLTGLEQSETLVNQQPGAGHVLEKNKGLCQQALDEETADMVKYIVDRQDKAARRAGLK